MTSPDNQTDINGLGLMVEREFGSLQTVSGVHGKPKELWLNEKSWLTEVGVNGTLGYAYTSKYEIDDWNGGFISFDSPSDAYEPIWMEWEITSNNFLVPKGQFKDYPWQFCQNDPNPYNDPHADPHPKNLNFDAPIALGAMDECVRIQGVKVHHSD